MQTPNLDEEFLAEGPIPVSDVTARALEVLRDAGGFDSREAFERAMLELRRQAFHVEA